MHSFYCFNYTLKLPLKNVTRLLVKAKIKENENWIIQRWIFNHSKDMSLEEFKDKITVKEDKQKISNLTEEEIMEDVEDILNSFKGGG